MIRALLILALAVVAFVQSFPEPDPSYTFTCSNAPTLRITATRSRPIPCGDTTAVTFGYLR